MAHDITSKEECAAAAAVLGLSDRTVSLDGQNRVSYDPKGCYYENNSLKYNRRNTNYGSCSTSDKCLCKTETSKQPVMLCVDTRQRNSLGWSYKGRTPLEATARRWCSAHTYMSLECPTGPAGFEVFCLNSWDLKSIPDRDCQGSPSVGYLNGGNNGHCSGPHKFGNVWGGGWHRGALYKI